MKKYNQLFILLALSIMIGCGDDAYSPKPKGYFRIDLPEKKYHPVEIDCPFVFEVADDTKITRNTNYPENLCWFNIDYPSLNASIYISYKPINDSLLPVFLEDSRTLAFKHTVKALDIKQQPLLFPERNVYGLVYEIEGNAASSYQFHLTDSVNHFIRGSLYFNNTPNQDSIQPVLDFVKDDIKHLYETLEWR